VSGAVKVCGQRGLLTFCHVCKDWEPFDTTPKRFVTGRVTREEFGSWCRSCGNRLLEVAKLRSEEDEKPEPCNYAEGRAVCMEVSSRQCHACGDWRCEPHLRSSAAPGVWTCVGSACEEQRMQEAADEPQVTRQTSVQRFNAWWGKHRPGSVAGRELALDAFLAGAGE
jgi:hypothetical protein